MRRKFVLLALVLAATVTAAQAKPAQGPRTIRTKTTCLKCDYCIGNTCYGCVVVARC